MNKEKSTKSLSFNILTTAPPDTSQTPRPPAPAFRPFRFRRCTVPTKFAAFCTEVSSVSPRTGIGSEDGGEDVSGAGAEAPAMGGNGGIDTVIPQEIYQRIALTDPGDDDGCTGGAIGERQRTPSEPLAVVPVEASSDVMEAV